jgi:hypothetical protein
MPALETDGVSTVGIMNDFLGCAVGAGTGIVGAGSKAGPQCAGLPRKGMRQWQSQEVRTRVSWVYRLRTFDAFPLRCLASAPVWRGVRRWWGKGVEKVVRPSEWEEGTTECGQ